jgi:plasmid maintenance system antidote protein VapI
MHGRRRLFPDTTAKLSAHFGNAPKFWLELQNDFDAKRKMP